MFNFFISFFFFFLFKKEKKSLQVISQGDGLDDTEPRLRSKVYDVTQATRFTRSTASFVRKTKTKKKADRF